MTPLVSVIDNGSNVLRELALHLERSGFSVHTYDGVDSFLRHCRWELAECVVTDMHMLEMQGLELLHQLLEEKHKIPVIVITAVTDVVPAVRAMKYATKHSSDTYRGELDRPDGNYFRSQPSSEVGRRLEFLSQRERQVLDGLVAGKPNKVIAHDLQLSPRTIEGYRAIVMAKMQARSFSELIRMVLVGSVDE